MNMHNQNSFKKSRNRGGKRFEERKNKYGFEKPIESQIITLQEAISLGYTPGFLRVLANCLESKSKRKEVDRFEYVFDMQGNVRESAMKERVHNFYPSLNMSNAYKFRQLAAELERKLQKENKSKKS